MYYPQSKIINNLYTNGSEFINKDTKTPYVGYYHKLYDGRLFSGKDPNDYPVFEIINNEFNFNNNIITENINIKGEDDIFISSYIGLKDIDPTLYKIIPTPYYPKPTKSDYDLGEFQRYFVKKINDNVFIEIDKNTYNNISSKNKEYAYSFYLPFSMSWTIYGNKVDIYNVNKNTVLYTEKNLNIIGLKEYLKFNYIKYYKYPIVDNLVTIGKQLQFYNKKEYIGSYSIDENKGFVINNSNGIQTLLYPIDQNIERQLLDEALKSIGRFTYPNNVYDSLKKK